MGVYVTSGKNPWRKNHETYAFDKSDQRISEKKGVVSVFEDIPDTFYECRAEGNYFGSDLDTFHQGSMRLMCQDEVVSSIEQFVEKVRADAQQWGFNESEYFPWFRGEPNSGTPLMPKLYRSKPKCGDYLENRLLQTFRQRAPVLGSEYTPHREHTDQWLFLAQHVGLPTRLLDWTEGALIALYFALQEQEPVVWMLNPFDLNRLSESEPTKKRGYNIYALTWHDPGPTGINIAQGNIAAAWGDNRKEVPLPVAVPVTHIHPRMTAQRSCFSVHGQKDVSLYSLLGDPATYERIKQMTGRDWQREDILRKYCIEPVKRIEMLAHLRLLGVSRVTLLPELDGLAGDLTRLFRSDLIRGI